MKPFKIGPDHRELYRKYRDRIEALWADEDKLRRFKASILEYVGDGTKNAEEIVHQFGDLGGIVGGWMIAEGTLKVLGGGGQELYIIGRGDAENG